MALYGILGGNIPDRELLNRMVDLVNFHYNSNIILNTRYLSNNGETVTTNRVSFYQYQNRLTLVSIYLSNSATALTDYPSIVSAVDRTGATVTYTSSATADEVKPITIQEDNYYLHFVKRKYTTSHTGDVWISFNPDSNKDFKTDIFQFMLVQHRETASLIDSISDGELSDYSWLNSITAILNSTLKISYAARIFDNSGNPIGYSKVWEHISDEWDLKSIAMDGYVTAAPGVNESFNLVDVYYGGWSEIKGGFTYSGTSYTKGYNFTFTNSDERNKSILSQPNDSRARFIDVIDSDGYSKSSMQHVNFNIKRFNIFIKATGDALSAHDLYMIFKTLDRIFALPFDGEISTVTTLGNMIGENTAVRRLKIKMQLSGNESFTVGTDVIIPIIIQGQ